MTTITPEPILEQSETFWAYLAGYVDGEGSITICQNGPRFVISNTHLETLTWIRESIGLGQIQEVKAKSHLVRRTRPCYNYSIGANGMRSLLPKLIPLLREKRPRAEKMMDYLATASTNPQARNDPAHVKRREDAREAFMKTVPDAWANKSEV